MCLLYNKEQGNVSCRVALLPRSSEIKPLLEDLFLSKSFLFKNFVKHVPRYKRLMQMQQGSNAVFKYVRRNIKAAWHHIVPLIIAEPSLNHPTASYNMSGKKYTYVFYTVEHIYILVFKNLEILKNI